MFFFQRAVVLTGRRRCFEGRCIDCVLHFCWGGGSEHGHGHGHEQYLYATANIEMHYNMTFPVTLSEYLIVLDGMALECQARKLKAVF